MSDDTLKPCPFCGGENHPYHKEGCFIIYAGYTTLEAYNTRPIEDALRAQLAAALDELETSSNNAATWKAETFQNFNRAKEAEAQLAAALEREKAYQNALGIAAYNLGFIAELLPDSQLDNARRMDALRKNILDVLEKP